MSEAWIEGCPVQRIMFRDGLVISLGDYKVASSRVVYESRPDQRYRRVVAE
ncbi:hypothetical protein RA983_19935 [Mycobacteroides abscessus subsp. abscessus]|uniref:hypothetical protein n=1 Tax=Mycobacteroides abscessus TaxID=36809 RepID=UPI00092C7291|nr:hypothetical protein [Mycobacteroides abscessus]MBE5449919.1 hypothetical protein [Mycobacteroides abscessus]MBE5464250.1 hypothetical protein [Mycobacteroides abscessus]MDO3006119.1 hypothetical protein [Mycobacteroides abscessus subsp. abscessus]MDO3021510.1 hypothetical protein [Mycobacteroides abscessus subsp. abscessus]MDO3194578.1 hypothetical protein [Mycobacteroides abscessus subsp. abscessus]